MQQLPSCNGYFCAFVFDEPELISSSTVSTTEKYRVIELSSLIPAYDPSLTQSVQSFMPENIFYRGFFPTYSGETVIHFKKRVLRQLMKSPTCRRWWRRHNGIAVPLDTDKQSFGKIPEKFSTNSDQLEGLDSVTPIDSSAQHSCPIDPNSLLSYLPPPEEPPLSDISDVSDDEASQAHPPTHTNQSNNHQKRCHSPQLHNRTARLLPKDFILFQTELPMPDPTHLDPTIPKSLSFRSFPQVQSTLTPALLQYTHIASLRRSIAPTTYSFVYPSPLAESPSSPPTSTISHEQYNPHTTLLNPTKQFTPSSKILIPVTKTLNLTLTCMHDSDALPQSSIKYNNNVLQSIPLLLFLVPSKLHIYPLPPLPSSSPHALLSSTSSPSSISSPCS